MKFTEAELAYLIQLLLNDLNEKQVTRGMDTPFECVVNAKIQVARLETMGSIVPDDLKKKAGEIVTPPAYIVGT